MAKILYSLAVNSETVNGRFILDSSIKNMPWSGGLDSGTHVLRMLEVEFNGELYDFDSWKDSGVKIPAVSLELKSVNIKTNPVKGISVEVDGSSELTDFVIVVGKDETVVIKTPQKT